MNEPSDVVMGAGTHGLIVASGSRRDVMNTEEFDYVIVGSGTAGSIVAARLAARHDGTVLLLEAGQSDWSWTLKMPAMYGRNCRGGPYNWAFWTAPQKNLKGRTVYQPRGRVLGGSSSINGMTFVRGHALDFDRWAEAGAAGWSYRDVLPYYKRCETFTGTPSPYRGTSGPVVIRAGNADHPINQAFLRSGEEAGYVFTKDYNGFQQDGFFCYDMNIDHGVRASSPHAYIRKLEVRSHLTVKTRARVTKIDFDGTRAIGVTCVIDGKSRSIRARRETILCAGVFHSPQLLMLSGVGPADHLRSHGIGVVADLKGVGANLTDHMYFLMQYESKKPVALNRYRRPDQAVLIGAEWFLFKTGVTASNQVEVGAFLRTDPAMAHPDMQIHFKPVLMEGWKLSRQHGFEFGVGTLRATSTGTVTLASGNPLDAPVIDPNYLDTREDLVDMRNTLKIAREIVQQSGFGEFRGRETTPVGTLRSDQEIDTFIRENARSAYHPVGTCRMGQDDGAVCTPDLKVRGLEGLRIADTSVFPFETSGNTNGPAIMLGERAADVIAGRVLAPEDLPVYAGSDRAGPSGWGASPLPQKTGAAAVG